LNAKTGYPAAKPIAVAASADSNNPDQRKALSALANVDKIVLHRDGENRCE